MVKTQHAGAAGCAILHIAHVRAIHQLDVPTPGYRQWGKGVDKSEKESAHRTRQMEEEKQLSPLIPWGPQGCSCGGGSVVKAWGLIFAKGDSLLAVW